MSDIDCNRMNEIQDVKQTGCGMVIAKASAATVAMAGVAVFAFLLAREAMEALWIR